MSAESLLREPHRKRVHVPDARENTERAHEPVLKIQGAVPMPLQKVRLRQSQVGYAANDRLGVLKAGTAVCVQNAEVACEANRHRSVWRRCQAAAKAVAKRQKRLVQNASAGNDQQNFTVDFRHENMPDVSGRAIAEERH